MEPCFCWLRLLLTTLLCLNLWWAQRPSSSETNVGAMALVLMQHSLALWHRSWTFLEGLRAAAQSLLSGRTRISRGYRSRRKTAPGQRIPGQRISTLSGSARSVEAITNVLRKSVRPLLQQALERLPQFAYSRGLSTADALLRTHRHAHQVRNC